MYIITVYLALNDPFDSTFYLPDGYLELNIEQKKIGYIYHI